MLHVDPCELARRADLEARRPVDLEHGPLLRATVAVHGPEDHGLVLTLHHVSSDAASLDVLWRDLDRAYAGEELAPPPVRYGDHAAWQAGRTTDADVAALVERLGEGWRPVDLPLAAPTPPEPAGLVRRPLDVTAEDLRRHGLRPVGFVLGALAALLQRYTDTDDVVLGVAAPTRDHPALEDLVGYSLGVVPLRLAVDPRGTPADTAASPPPAAEPVAGHPGRQLVHVARTHRHIPRHPRPRSVVSGRGSCPGAFRAG